MGDLPVIDVSRLAAGDEDPATVAEIDRACRRIGFFYVVGHGVPATTVDDLDRLARDFFALPEDEKAAISMAHGGRAWRGWFPVGGELTSGRPDVKEGLYFGQELGPDDPHVRAGIPLHGPNLFPARPTGLRSAVLQYMDQVTAAGQVVLRGVAGALGLDPTWFEANLTADPLVLFRIFHYPPGAPVGEWGVAEHTDYGLITLLHQDTSGGLEVHARDGWIVAPPVPGSFVVNLGDMLELMTGGRYVSTPHRVRNATGGSRLSFPLFLDPSWDARVIPVPALDGEPEAATRRWDGADVRQWTGTYGDYLSGKVGKVFPALGSSVLDDPST